MNGPSSDNRIAIVGMAGRFPGAPDLGAFWRNLRDGVESISFYSDDELRQLHVDPAWLSNPNFVPARPYVEGRELFDAGFFGYSAQEAEIIDPQQRLFLEVGWEALEHAGYAPDAYDGLIGVYGGSSQNTYLWFNLLVRPGFFQRHGMLRTIITNGPDYLATRAAYKLNLRGPSVTVQTACSTSLVALHLACQGLLNFECDMALAGGASLRVTPIVGYLYETGGLLSRDGHCRAFDAAANGTLFGDGIGAVVLKRLEDAVSDGDTIHAVVLGSAVNNDGALKAGFTAPAPAGQARVVFQALESAGVSADSISYVEAHGTGTDLGDPIEIAALTKAFRASTSRRGFCAVGSVKTNIGHLDAAAGIAGIIKTVLALEHREIPATLHFHAPNPEIDFAASPFFVNAGRRDWTAESGPRRAGVSAFGIGGTNAHVVLEEAPAAGVSGPSRPAQLIVVSARSETALGRAASGLATFLRAEPALSLADVAYTLSVGRRAFPQRLAIVARSIDEAVQRLEHGATERPNDADGVFDELLGLGRRWVAGDEIDWTAHWRGEHRRRIPLPTYPFERQRYWSEPFAGADGVGHPAQLGPTVGAHYGPRELRDWFEVPVWRQSSALPTAVAPATWLVVADTTGFSALAVETLRQRGDEPVVVAGDEDFVTVLDRLRTEGRAPTRILWCASARGESAPDAAGIEQDAFYGPLALMQALATAAMPVQVTMVTTNVFTAIGHDGLMPDGALAVGVARVASRELAGITTRVVDLPLLSSPRAEWPALAQAALGEFDIDDRDTVVAYRNGRRWVPGVAPLPLDPPPDAGVPLRERGTYLVTGGFGGLGLAIATALAERLHATLVLVGRRAPDPATCARLEAAGATLHVVTADVADAASLRRGLAVARARFGRIDGVIHAAGVAGGGLIALKNRDAAAAVLRPKVAGTRAVLTALEDQVAEGHAFPDFVAFFSSVAGLTGDVGQVDYAAANAWLDATAQSLASAGRRVVSINWDAWQEVGMAVETAVSGSLRDSRAESVSRGIPPGQGVEAFFRAIAQPFPQVVVSPSGLSVRMSEADAGAALITGTAAARSTRHPRPDLSTPFVTPTTAIERRLAAIWEDLLGADGVGVNDNFFDLGGDSLLATQLTASIRTGFGRELTLRDIMERATIAELARAVDGDAAPADSSDDARLLDELAQMSDEEAEARLRALLNSPEA